MDWNIARSGHRCSKCDREFAEEESYFSALHDTGADFGLLAYLARVDVELMPFADHLPSHGERRQNKRGLAGFLCALARKLQLDKALAKPSIQKRSRFAALKSKADRHVLMRLGHRIDRARIKPVHLCDDCARCNKLPIFMKACVVHLSLPFSTHYPHTRANQELSDPHPHFHQHLINRSGSVIASRYHALDTRSGAVIFSLCAFPHVTPGGRGSVTVRVCCAVLAADIAKNRQRARPG